MNRKDAGLLGAVQSNKTQLLKFQKVREDYEKDPKHCPQCLKPIPYEKRHCTFCNSSCSATYTNARKPKKPVVINQYHRDYVPKEVTSCRFCGKEILGSTRVYCDNTCQRSYEWKIRREEIIAAGGFEKETPLQAKRLLKELHGSVCSICDYSEWNGQAIPLILDHIDGNASNNLLDNLRLICPNCDALLPTYKNKNKGNGRFSRRKRYQEKKSY